MPAGRPTTGSFPYYRDRALCLALGVTPYEMFLQAVGAADDPASGGRQMPSHWGHRRLQHRLAGQPNRLRSASRPWDAPRPAPLFGTLPGTRRPRTRVRGRTKSRTCRSATASTSEGEFWESLNTACMGRLPVVYLIEDNGWAISVPVEVQTPGGSISDLLRSFPHLLIVKADGTDFVDSYRAMREARRLRAGASRPGAGARHGRAPVFAFAVGRRASVQDAGGAGRREPARPACGRWRGTWWRGGIANEKELEAIHAEVEREIERRRHARARRAEAGPRHGRTVGVLAGRRSGLGGVQRPPRHPRASRTRWSPPSTGRSRTRWRAIPRIVVFGEDVADCSREASLEEVQGKGGVFKVTHGLQRHFGSDRVFNSPLAEANIIGRAVGHGAARPQAGRRDPVLRLHLARDAAAARRDVDDALPVGQPLVVPDGGPRARSAATCAAARRTTASPASASSPTRRASGSSSRRTPRTPPACCGRPSGATTR